jgi:hypothetical protein
VQHTLSTNPFKLLHNREERAEITKRSPCWQLLWLPAAVIAAVTLRASVREASSAGMCIHMIGYLHVRYATAGSTLCYHRGFCTPATQHHTKRYDMPVYSAARACCCCCLAAAARQGPQPTILSGHASVNCIATARAAVAVQGETHTYATASSAAPQQL